MCALLLVRNVWDHFNFRSEVCVHFVTRRLIGIICVCLQLLMVLMVNLGVEAIQVLVLVASPSVQDNDVTFIGRVMLLC